MRLLAALGCSAVAAACVAERLRVLAREGPTDFDDAYMFLRYAGNLLAGHGLAWNPGEPAVHGVTSPLHLALVTLLRAALPAAPDGRVLQAASAGAGLLAVGSLVYLCGRFARAAGLRGAYPLWAALLLPPLTMTEAFAFHLRSGMDTMTALLANTWVAFAALWLAEAPSPRRAAAAAAPAYLALLARPDGALCAVGAPLLAVALLCPAPRARLALAFGAPLAAVALADLALRARLLGTALPLAFYAKRPLHYGGFAGEYAWNPYLFLAVFLGAALPFLVVLAAAADRTSARTTATLLAPVVPTFAVLFGFNQIMGHMGRFFFPALPFLVVAAALALDGLVRARTASARALTVRLGLAALAVVAGDRALEAAGRRYEGRGAAQVLAPLDGYQVTAALPPEDSWLSSRDVGELARRAPAGTVLAMSEHGLVGARAPRAIIVDVLGLHDPAFALRGFSAAELFRRRPDVIWMPHPDHTAMVREILDSDELWSSHDFYPEAFTYGLAARREGPRAGVVRRLVEDALRARYPEIPLEDLRARR